MNTEFSQRELLLIEQAVRQWRERLNDSGLADYAWLCELAKLARKVYEFAYPDEIDD